MNTEYDALTFELERIAMRQEIEFLLQTLESIANRHVDAQEAWLHHKESLGAG